MQKTNGCHIKVVEGGENGRKSRFLLLEQLKYLPENERVSLAQENNIQ
jgi:hypothetical protein